MILLVSELCRIKKTDIYFILCNGYNVYKVTIVSAKHSSYLVYLFILAAKLP